MAETKKDKGFTVKTINTSKDMEQQVAVLEKYYGITGFTALIRFLLAKAHREITQKEPTA